MGQYFKAALIDNEWGVKVINLNWWNIVGIEIGVWWEWRNYYIERVVM